jgi:hypothetical protein
MNSCTTGAISWLFLVIRGGGQVVSGLLLRRLIVGILGGLLAAAFSFLAGEPSIERAFAFETAIKRKYPADPPAIGAPDTVGARTALYFAMLAISLAIILAATLALVFSGMLGAWNGALVAAAVFVAVAGLAALALPPVDEAPVNCPASVLWNFRLASIGARALLWAARGLTFGGMTQIWLRGGTPSRS